jgi:hypothetical protein
MNRTPPATLFAIATAVAAIGSLAYVSPAQAYPSVPLLPRNACRATAGYQFPGGAVTINYPGIGETRFTTPTGTHVDTSAETFYQNGTSLKGTVTGDITKGSLINLTVTRGDKYSPLLLSGDVGPDNIGHGAYTFENHDTALWDMTDELSCQPGPPPAPVLPPRTDNKPVAGTNTLGTATVVADTDMYDKPDGLGQKIGTLFVGEQHPLMEPCRDDWCRVGTIELGGFPGLPNGTAWVYAKGFLTIS